MEKIIVQKNGHVSLNLSCNSGIAMELNEYFSFFVPGYKFMPAYKNKVWDGKVRLFNRNTYELPVGLYHYLSYFARERGYEIDPIEGSAGLPSDQNTINPKEIDQFLSSLDLRSRGNKIGVRDYQFQAICRGIKDKRAILLSPTGSGKSLIIYSLLRWYLENYDDKVLIIVPTTSLVEQMYSDFADYSSHDTTFDAKEMCHTIFSGKPKTNIEQRVFISTWQSVYKLPGTWFDQFGAVFGDECHGFKSKSLTSIMNKSRRAEYRFGTTGTLDGTQTHQLVLEGLFGRLFDVTTTKKLQEDNTLAQLDISLLTLKYPKSVTNDWGKRTYQEEIDYIVRNEARNRFIKNLALDQKGNTLVLFQFVEKHGKPLFQIIRDDVHENRKVYFVSGDVETEDREAIRGIVEQQKDSIIVASLGTFSTGINIRNLHNIIFASPSKSQIRVLQSIGRGLRKSDDGRTTHLYDVVDDITGDKARKNFAFIHGVERLKMYEKQGFNYKIYKIDLGE